ncbi:MAG: hypothetical protein A2284_12615 [Deltaproteobacteria bacterium RIFOXYA12_FULL_61_11]|nr:MAG: hypothetical protein A2284_12615 [Deltaproteobacteria bacterium RIFOXYA12_FULL_61_11]
MLSRKAALLLILAACCTLFGAEVLARPMRAECTGPAAPGEQFLGQVTPAEANTLLKVFGQSKRFLLLDVRTESEYEAGHLAGSRQLDFYAPDFPKLLAAIPRDVVILVYCASGNRSKQTMTMLGSLCFPVVLDLQGGVKRWVGEGYPLVQ